MASSSSTLSEVSEPVGCVSDEELIEGTVLEYEFEKGTVLTPEMVKDMPSGITHLNMNGVVAEKRMGYSSLFCKFAESLVSLTFSFKKMANSNTKIAFVKAIGRYIHRDCNSLKYLTVEIDTHCEWKEFKEKSFKPMMWNFDRLEHLKIVNTLAALGRVGRVICFSGESKKSLSMSVYSLSEFDISYEKDETKRTDSFDKLISCPTANVINLCVGRVSSVVEHEGLAYFLKKASCYDMNLTIKSWSYTPITKERLRVFADCAWEQNYNVHLTLSWCLNTYGDIHQEDILKNRLRVILNEIMRNFHTRKEELVKKEDGYDAVLFNFKLKLSFKYAIKGSDYQPGDCLKVVTVSLKSQERKHSLFSELVLPIPEIDTIQ